MRQGKMTGTWKEDWGRGKLAGREPDFAVEHR